MRELKENDAHRVDGGSLNFWDFDEPVVPLECLVPSYPKFLERFGFPVEPINPY